MMQILRRVSQHRGQRDRRQAGPAMSKELTSRNNLIHRSMQEDELTGIQDHSANLFQPVGLRKFNHSIAFDG